MTMTKLATALSGGLAALLLAVCAGCASGDGRGATPVIEENPQGTPTESASGHEHTDSEAATDGPPSAPLRAGERFLDLAMPGGAYSPESPRGGKDEYRCFLLDPRLPKDTFVTGVEVLPGRVEIGRASCRERVLDHV